VEVIEPRISVLSAPTPLNGIMTRQSRTNTYQLAADGQRVANFYTKVLHDFCDP
jgi:hypothetical protein